MLNQMIVKVIIVGKYKRLSSVHLVALSWRRCCRDDKAGGW